MTVKTNFTIVAVFQDDSKAQQAVRELKQAGFRDDQLGVVSHDRNAVGEKHTEGTHVTEGAVTGVAAGAGIGALWALGIAAGFMPVIGPVVAGGLLASVLASAAGGAAIAGIVGALVGLGIPEEEAQYYEGEFKAGRTIVTVKPEGRYDEAWAILSRYGAYNKQSTPVASATASTTARKTARSEGGETLEVHEERLHARKTPVQTGEVNVRKEVVTEQQTLQVPVTREEVVIERRPAAGRASSSDIQPGAEIRIPVKEEHVRVEKDTVVNEEVSVGKRKVTENEQVSGTVRKERVKVEKSGDVEVREDDITNKSRK